MNVDTECEKSVAKQYARNSLAMGVMSWRDDRSARIKTHECDRSARRDKITGRRVADVYVEV